MASDLPKNKEPRELFYHWNDIIKEWETREEKERWDYWHATEEKRRVIEARKAREAAKLQPKPQPVGKPRMGDQKHPITIIYEKAPSEMKMYKNAFFTKFKKGKPEEKRTIPVEPPRAVPRKMASEWYEPGTWFMDLVNFGSMWYVFFVEANSSSKVFSADWRNLCLHSFWPLIPNSSSHSHSSIAPAIQSHSHDSSRM